MSIVSISIHSLRKEGDRNSKFLRLFFSYFNPLPPQGGRQHKTYFASNEIGISIHSLRKEGDAMMQHADYYGYNISIHSLRKEGDYYDISPLWDKGEISIHSLRKEGDWSH